MFNKLKSRKGSGYIDIVILCIVMMMFLVGLLNIAPVFIMKMSLDTYANELIREFEIAGRVDTETTNRLVRLNEVKNLNPNVSWTKTGKVQIGSDVTVTVTKVVDIGFSTFGSFPITLKSTAVGTSEVFWK